MDIKLQNPIFFNDPKGRSYWSNLLRPIAHEKTSPSKKKTFTNEEKIRIVIDGQSNVLPIEDLCSKEGIDVKTFNNWTKEFLSAPNTSVDEDARIEQRKEEDKFRIVIEGKTGITSIAEICRRASKQPVPAKT